MGRFKRDSVLFVCGRMTASAHAAFAQLVEQAPRWMDVHLAGFGVEGDTERPPVVVGKRTFEHRMFTAAELSDFDFPVKLNRPVSEFSLIPGNTDLIQLRFARDHPGYRRYWSVEDDVRFGGDWADIFDHLRRSRAALLGTTMRRRSSDPKWFWWSHFAPPHDVRLPAGYQPVASFLPFAAATPAAFEAISAGYRSGWGGHYESLWPTLVELAGLPIRDVGGKGEFVRRGDEGRFYTNTGRLKLAPGTFVYRPHHADYDRESAKLWHPLREGLPAPKEAR